MAEPKKIPAARFIKQNSNFAALASKLIQNRTRERTYINEAGGYNLMTQTSSFEAISKDIQESAKNTESIISLFPDMELSIQILISSVLSPKDMMGDELIYKVRNDFLTPDLTSKLINVIKSNIEDYYKIKEKLPEILREVLFISGAYPYAIIPESELDIIINSNANISTESLRKSHFINKDNEFYNIGILGNKGVEDYYDEIEGKINSTPSFESLDSYHDFSFGPSKTEHRIGSNGESDEDPIFKYIRVSDNPDILKMPLVLKTKVEQLATEAIQTRFKGYNKLLGRKTSIAQETPDLSEELGKLRDALYKPASNRTNPFLSFSDIKPLRKSIGRPLVLRLPPEAVIPVHTPGDPDNHVGYFILVDQHGSPLHMVEKVTALTELDEGLLKPDNSMDSILVQRAKDNISGKNIKGLSMDNYVGIYTDLIEKELLSRLQSGIYGKNVEVARVNEVYNIMLFRALKNQMTRLIYMPVQMVEYIRYKIHPNGVGKALSENLRILLSLRAMMLFSRLMGSVKNSIGITSVNLKLDERDPDPQKTIEIVKNEILRARQQNFPIGISTPMDLADWVQRSGLQFSFEGHPRIPDMKIEYEQHGASNIMPDAELDEDLRKRTIMSYGLSPETVDNGFSPEFATTVVANNILLSKRVMTIQKTFLFHIKNLVNKIVMADPIIMEELRKIVSSGLLEVKQSIKTEKEVNDEVLIEFIIQEFLDILEIELPTPQVTAIENQMDSFDKYQEFLEKALDAWVSPEMFSVETAGDLSGKMETIKSMLKSYYTRKWMTENGVMEELGDISNDLSDSSLFKLQEAFMMKIIKNSTGFFTDMQAMVQAVNQDLTEYKVGGDNPADTGDTGAVGDEFGMDDLGGGLDEESGKDLGLTPEEQQDEAQVQDSENEVRDDNENKEAGEKEQQSENKETGNDGTLGGKATPSV